MCLHPDAVRGGLSHASIVSREGFHASAAAKLCHHIPEVSEYSRGQKYLDTPGPEWKRKYLNGYKINRDKTTLRRYLFRAAFSWYDSLVDRIIRCLEILNNVIFMGSAAVAMMGSTAFGIP